MKNSLRPGVCTAAEWPALLAALDETFVSGRGRTGSLAARFPAALGPSHLADLRVLREGDRIVSCCLARRFAWQGQDEHWQGAMIGMVWTQADARGRGCAARVLDFTLAQLDAAGLDFAVLWSSLPHFYERLGWQRHDRGVLGVGAGEPHAAHPADPRPNLLMLEALRNAHQRLRVQRSPEAWQALPLPASRTRLMMGSEAAAGYALVGELETSRYVFDLVAEAAAFPALWAQIVGGVERVCVNDSIGSDFHRWIARHTRMQFSAQHLSHWWPLSYRARSAPWRDWHIPWFDRI